MNTLPHPPEYDIVDLIAIGYPITPEILDSTNSSKQRCRFCDCHSESQYQNEVKLVD